MKTPAEVSASVMNAAKYGENVMPIIAARDAEVRAAAVRDAERAVLSQSALDMEPLIAAVAAIRALASGAEAQGGGDEPPPCYDCGQSDQPRSACPLCGKIVCKRCADLPKNCCDEAPRG